MSLTSRENSLNFPKDLYKKVCEIYSNYGLDMSDMTQDEINRICSHYYHNPKDLEKDLLNSQERQYSNKKILVEKEGE